MIRSPLPARTRDISDTWPSETRLSWPSGAREPIRQASFCPGRPGDPSSRRRFPNQSGNCFACRRSERPTTARAWSARGRRSTESVSPDLRRGDVDRDPLPERNRSRMPVRQQVLVLRHKPRARLDRGRIDEAVRRIAWERCCQCDRRGGNCGRGDDGPHLSRKLAVRRSIRGSGRVAHPWQPHRRPPTGR